MKYIFTLHDTTNDKIFEYNEGHDWKDEGLMLFQWTQNNYDCDCNRSIFIYDDEDNEYECGEKIKLTKITREDGSLVDFSMFK